MHKANRSIPSRPKATAVLRRHQAGRITLAIANTVGSANGLHHEFSAELKKQTTGKDKKGGEPMPTPELYLLHSRFRRKDRDVILERIQAFQSRQPKDGTAVADHPGIVIVSTQVIEAGYDLSSSNLWSEIAPWASVIPRLGRLNRDGLCDDARAFLWMPKPEPKGENLAEAPNARRIGPYDKQALDSAKALLVELVARIGHANSGMKH